MPPLILITRPIEAANSFAARLAAELGPQAEILLAPLMEIRQLPDLPALSVYRTLIFTSSHAVDAFAQATTCRDFTCYAVGKATGEKASACGLSPIVGPGTGRELAIRIRNDAPATPCLHLRGDHVAFDIAGYLNFAGTETHDAIIYEQVPLPLPDDVIARVLQAHTIVVPVFSPRSAQLLLDALPNGTNLQIAAISNAVAEVIPSAKAHRIEVAETPDGPAMLACVARLWSHANRLEGRDRPQ